jgi:hypothetical protein
MHKSLVNGPLILKRNWSVDFRSACPIQVAMESSPNAFSDGWRPPIPRDASPNTDMSVSSELRLTSITFLLREILGSILFSGRMPDQKLQDPMEQV